MRPLNDRSSRATIHSPYVFELAYDQCWFLHIENGPPEYVEIVPVGRLHEWLKRDDIEYATGYVTTISYHEDRRRGDIHAYIVLYDLPTATMYRLMFT